MKNVISVYLWALVSKVVAVLISVIGFSLQVRVLGQYYTGIYSYANSSLGIVAIIATFCIHEAYAFYRKQNGENYKQEYIGAVQLITLIYIVGCVIFSMFVGENFVHSVILIGLPIMVYSKCVSMLVVIDRPGLKNYLEVLINLIYVLVLLVLKNKVSNELVLFLVVGRDLLYGMIFSWLEKIRFHINSNSIKRLKELALFGAIPMISLVLTRLNYRVDVLMLEKYASYDRIGVYSAGASLAEQCWIIPETIRDILLSRIVNNTKMTEITKTIKYSFWAVFSIGVVVLAFGKIIVLVMFGEDFVDSYYIAVVELFGVMGMVYMKIVMAYNVVENRQINNLVILTVGVLANVLLNGLLISRYEIFGAAFATFLSYSLIGGLFAYDYIKNTNEKIKDLLIIDRKDIKALLKRKGK